MYSLCRDLNILLNVVKKPSTVLHASCPAFVRVCMRFRLSLSGSF